MLHAARCKCRMQKSSKICHLGTIAQLCQAISLQLMHVSTSGKNLLSSSRPISSTCPHNMVNFGPLAPEIGPVVLGTPTNVNGFRVLAALLQRHRSTEANHTLHGLWPCPGLVHYIYIFGGSCPVIYGMLPRAKFILHPASVALSYFGSVTAQHLEQWARAKLRR